MALPPEIMDLELKKPVTVTVFTMPKCANCPAAKEVVDKVASRSDKIEVKHVDLSTDMVTGLLYQVMSTPSIAIGEDAVFRGEVPSEEQLVAEIVKRAGQ